MQIFHIDHQIKNGKLTITDEDTINQCRKILRLKVGDLIHVQSTLANTTTRHLINIQEISDRIIGEIVETQYKTRSSNLSGMIIAMSNKRDKIETIAQKLTEIGINQIIFRPSDRSVIKERNQSKAQRIQKIIKEATEQSFNRFLPELSYRENPEDLLSNSNCVIFDNLENATKINIGMETKLDNIKTTYGIIGPEGGLSPKDHAIFAKYNPQIFTLGDTILRTETAAIIGARIIKNLT